jgi:hypothetical protein
MRSFITIAFELFFRLCHQDRLVLNGTHQLPVSMMGKDISTIKKITEVLLEAGKEVGPEVNTEKTKYMV